MAELKLISISLTLLIAMTLSSSGAEMPQVSSIKKVLFGKMKSGKRAYVYTLKNTRGMEARITNYGGILLSLKAPDRNQNFDDVVLGYDSLSQYIRDNPYFGSLIGRYGNRIGNAKFTLNGVEYKLAKNNGPNHLHGGLKGFDKVVWNVEEKESVRDRSLVLTYLSKDKEEGYPGNLSVKVVYTLNDNNELRIDYKASTDKPTVLNLTHHSYFNLAGAGKRDILEHQLMINASVFTPVDSTLIPTGELRKVRGTPMDFTVMTAIGARINQQDEQLRVGGGYDHNWVLDKSGNELALAAQVYEPSTGRVVEVFTTEPGLQFYSGNFLNGSHVGKGGKRYEHRFGLCLETQHFPDSPNKQKFPSTILNPGRTYLSTTIYRFSAKK